MDWASISRFLADRSGLPKVLLDRQGRIRLLSRAMEEALGWRRSAVEGRPWAEVVVSSGQGTGEPAWLNDALRGAARHVEAEVRSHDGRYLRLSMESHLIGRGRSLGLVLTVLSMTPSADGPARDVDYQIRVTATDFGSLERLSGRPGAALSRDGAPVSKCYSALYERDQPCQDCPARLPPAQSWPRTAVRHVADTPERFEVLTAQVVNATSVRIRHRTIDGADLAAIQVARVATLAERARLTRREREILNYLLLGHSLDDIASALTLSRRTVKFHQNNILEKLGADSRTDLIRLVGF